MDICVNGKFSLLQELAAMGRLMSSVTKNMKLGYIQLLLKEVGHMNFMSC